MKALLDFTIPRGLFLLSLSGCIRYHIGRRRFNRSEIGGLPQFSGYAKAVDVAFLERLILFIANLCSWVGLFLLALTGFNHLKF